MKTIEVSDDVYNRLMEMSDLMEKQDNRATSSPLFAVYEKIFVPNIHGEGDIVRYHGPETDGEIHEKSLIEYLREWIGDEEFEEKTKSLDKSDRQYIEEVADVFGLTKNTYDVQTAPCGYGGSGSQIYITEKAADEHINSNHYHYHEAFTYVVSGCRNEEMKFIQDFIYNLKYPGRYKH